MFKKLKDKIAEEVKQSPSKISATVSQLAQAVVSPSSSSIVEPTSISDLNFSISEDAEEQSSPAKQGFTSVDLREDLRETSVNVINMMRSRHSSTSSLVSDNASFFPHYEPHGSSFHLQSDLESASEMDDSYSTQATSTSKEQLVGLLRKSQQRYNKYKGRYADLAKHYRELERDNFKAKSILSESQDKALRRIAELKEQCQLEQRAKAHLEEILRNDLEEKDHLIMTLNTKIDLLKLNDSPDTTLESSFSSSAPTELNSQSNDVQNMFAETLIDISDQKDSANESTDAARDKVKKLEILLAKCKDAIRTHKEKVKEYSTENEQLKSDLFAIQETSNGHLKNLEAAQAEIVWLKKREEESALSLAETKRSIHSEMEIKEEQIKHLRQSIQDLMVQKDELSSKCNKLETQVSEIKQTQEVEKSSDNEKQIQELSRVKQEAMKILQSKYNETVSDLKTQLNTKIGELEKQIQELTEKNELLQKNSVTSREEMEKQIQELTEKNELLQKNSKTSQELMEKQIKELTETNHLLQNNSVTSREEMEKKIQELTEKNELLQNNSVTSQEDMKKQIKELTETNQLLQNNSLTSREEMEKQIKELTEKHELLKNDSVTSHEDMKKQIKELRDTNQLLQNSSLTSQEQLEKQIRELTDTNELLQNTNASSQLQLKEYAASALALQSQIKQLEMEIDSLQTKVKVAEVQATLNDNVSESKHTENMEMLEKVIANLQESNSQLQTQYSALDKTLLEKEHQIHEFLAESKRFNDENSALSQMNMRLDKEVQDLTAALSSANVCVSKVRIQLQDTLQEHESKVNANQDEMKVVSNKLLTLTDKVASMEKESEGFKNTIAANECSLAELRAQLSASQEQLESCRVSLSEESAAKQELELGFRKSESQVASSLQEIGRHEELVKSLQTMLESKDAELNTVAAQLTSQKDEFVAQINILNIDKVKLVSQLAEKQADLNSLRIELTALKDSINVKEESLALQHRREQEELTEQVKLLNLSKEKLALQLAEKQAELSSHEVEFAALEASNVTLNNTLSVKQSELNNKTEEFAMQVSLLNADKENLSLALAEKVAELTSQREEYAVKVNLLISEKEEVNSELAETKAALTNQLSSLSTYDEKCASMVANKQAEIERILLELSQTQEISRKAISEKEQLLATLSENSKELDGKSMKLAELEEKLTTVGEAPEKLLIVTEELSQANTKNGQLFQQLEEKSVLQEELHETLATVRSDLEKVRAEKHQLEKELKTQASQGTDLSEVVKQFQNEKQQSCSQFEELQVKLESQEQDIDNLTQRLNECTSALQQRNVEFDEYEEKQRQKIKILARDFDEKMHLREEELSKLFDEERGKLESTEGLALNQLRTHIKALKSEVRQAQDIIANLNQQNKDLMKQQGAEILALEEKMKDAALANEFELRECEQKWRSTLERELSDRETIHKEEVNALSKEWSLERKTNNSTEMSAPNQELESTSKVAVAAVESGTGSIDLMHRQLLSITRELNEAKRRHKMETIELRRIIENRSKGGETTELEYLRNILFEYMMGREPTVLARVIAAVLKFDQDQTNKIIEKEEHKQSLLGHLGIL